MSQLIISQASLHKLPALNRLFVDAVQSHFTYFPEDVRRRVIREHSTPRLIRAALDPRRILLTAQIDGQIVGYAIGSVPRTGPAQLYWLYVNPDRRGQNAGRKLISGMLKLQQQKGAREVSITTFDHRHYYERQGFKFISRQDIDGVTMDVLTFKL